MAACCRIWCLQVVVSGNSVTAGWAPGSPNQWQGLHQPQKENPSLPSAPSKWKWVHSSKRPEHIVTLHKHWCFGKELFESITATVHPLARSPPCPMGCCLQLSQSSLDQEAMFRRDRKRNGFPGYSSLPLQDSEAPHFRGNEEPLCKCLPWKTQQQNSQKLPTGRYRAGSRWILPHSMQLPISKSVSLELNIRQDTAFQRTAPLWTLASGFLYVSQSLREPGRPQEVRQLWGWGPDNWKGSLVKLCSIIS